MVDDMARMLMRNVGKYEDATWDPRDNMGYVTGRRTEVLTLWAGKRLSGFAAFRPDTYEGQDVMFILELHLDDELRGASIGPKLLWAVEHAGRAAGRDGMALRVSMRNQAALAFYEKRPQLELSPAVVAAPEEQHTYYQYIWAEGARDAILQKAKARDPDLQHTKPSQPNPTTMPQTDPKAPRRR